LHTTKSKRVEEMKRKWHNKVAFHLTNKNKIFTKLSTSFGKAPEDIDLTKIIELQQSI